MMDYVLYKNIDDKYLTLKDCIEENEKSAEDGEEAAEVKESEDSAEAKESGEGTEAKETGEDAEEKKKTTIYYVTDPVQQSQYINMFREQGMDAVILKHNIDSAFITHVERANEEVKFQRIDADLTEDLKETGADLAEETKAMEELFRKALNNDKLEVKVENLKNDKISSMVTLSEESRRMEEMMKMYGMGTMDTSMFGGQQTLILNAKHPLVKYIFEHRDSEDVPVFCEQLYDLAMISNKPLTPEGMTKFIARSNEIMMKLAN